MSNTPPGPSSPDALLTVGAIAGLLKPREDLPDEMVLTDIGVRVVLPPLCQLLLPLDVRHLPEYQLPNEHRRQETEPKYNRCRLEAKRLILIQRKSI